MNPLLHAEVDLTKSNRTDTKKIEEGGSVSKPSKKLNEADRWNKKVEMETKYRFTSQNTAFFESLLNGYIKYGKLTENQAIAARNAQTYTPRRYNHGDNWLNGYEASQDDFDLGLCGQM